MTCLKVSLLCSDDCEITLNLLFATFTLMYLSTSFTTWHLEAKRICDNEQNKLAQFMFMSFTNNPVTCVRYEIQPVRQITFVAQNGVFICSFNNFMLASVHLHLSVVRTKQTLCSPLKDRFTCPDEVLCGVIKQCTSELKVGKTWNEKIPYILESDPH